MKNEWIVAKRKDVEDEFVRLVDVLMNQGDVGVLIDLIPFCNQHDFVKSWHEGDELDQ